MDLPASIARARELAVGLDDAVLRRRAAEVAPLVARWRWADARAVVHRPEPWLAIRERADGGWRDEGGDDVLRVGLDHLDRPLIVEYHHYGPVEIHEVWDHAPDGSHVLGRVAGGNRRVTLFSGPWDQVSTVTWAQDGGEEFGVERWTWHDGVPVRGEVADVSVDGWVLAGAFAADVDGTELRGLRHGRLDRDEITEDNRVPADGVIDALLQAVEAARDVDCALVVWRADIHAPEPVLRDTDELVAALATGLTAAIHSVLVAAEVTRPFVVEHRPNEAFEHHGAQLPGFVRIGSQRFRDRMRALSARDGTALQTLWKGESSGEVVRASLDDACDADTLRACRELNSALARDLGEPDHRRARTVLELLGLRLTAELNDGPVPVATADPFLALTEVGDPYRPPRDGLSRAATALGRERVERFRASLVSAVDDHVTSSADLAGARRDRGVLETWMRDRGLERAHELAQAAVPGFRLERSGARPARSSRIGGPGLLPPGSAWPRTTAGQPLTFLAGIDLTALPREAAGTDILPAAGWLLFFADLDEEGEGAGFTGEPTLNQEGADARVLWVAPEETPVDGVPPDDLAELLPERPVRADVCTLTLEDGYDTAVELGLDAAEGEAYDEIASALRDGLQGEGWDGTGDDWVLGAVTGVQGHSPGPGTVLLLHLGSIEFLDGGAIQFRISENALRRSDWARAYAEGDSS